ILFVLGLKIENPTFNKTISYQKINEKWYPKLFRWDAKIALKKSHVFKANEHSKINIGQIFFINKIDLIASPIPKEKLFDAKKNMEDQVHNNINIKWRELNIIKN
ncbi:MAG: hypothetical protein L3J08_07310, partial [Flavobacteriaceae bacterium]|nr:hypothetical protein [Flavobacteriaceae bacterium]